MANTEIAITLNGCPQQVPAGTTLAELLACHGWLGKRVAVERNGAIVPKSQFDAVRLEAGDILEVVVAVGGG